MSGPRFIESNRLAPFKPRGTDVSVVLDLMIHDIDLIEHIVRSPIASIDAIGAPVFTDEIDIANARIRFANGCVADVTASRISLKAERKLRVFQADAYLSIDLQQKLLTIVRKPAVFDEGGMPKVDLEERSFDQGDALLDEIRSFVDAVRSGGRPVVSGEDGLRALETATRIVDLVNRGAGGGGASASTAAPAGILDGRCNRRTRRIPTTTTKSWTASGHVPRTPTCPSTSG